MKFNTPTRRTVRFILPVIAMFAVVFGAYMLKSSSTEAQRRTATVTIRNNSDWNLNHFYVSPHNQNTWGPDQLGAEIIGNGESFTLTDIPCDAYDLKLVDEDGDQCIITDIDICNEDLVWTIDQSVLANCGD
jgi:hypothetical protein